MKRSAAAHSSATMGGWERWCLTTETRTPALDRFEPVGGISVSGEQNHMVQWGAISSTSMASFDIHVSLQFAPAHGIGEFLGRLRDHRVTVVVPAQSTSGRNERIFLILMRAV